MRIESSNLALQGSSYSATVVNTYRSQEVVAMKMVDPNAPNNPERSITRIRGDDYEGGENPFPEGEKDKVTVSTQPQVVHKANSLGGYSTLMTRNKLRMMILEQLLQRLNGSGGKFHSHSEAPQSTGYDSRGQAVLSAPSRQMATVVRDTFEMETVREEGFSFSAKGSVVTGDGRSINLELNFSFSQSFRTSTTIVSEIERRLVDPLVISFDGKMPELADNTMSFDLDCDGMPDDMRMMKPGSGFIALDKNENGRIDDGSELFGPLGEDGFKELAKYDEDGNGWIDEDDSIFGKLKIWSADSHGREHLDSIEEHGIGALYLGIAKTEMNLLNEAQNTGKLQKSGLVLLEGGESRMMQEIDLRI